MEAREGLLEKIIPPRLEDAGLEDCALSPDSIREAFLKAASAVGSRAASVSSPSDDEDCLHDPWPTAGDSSNALVGMNPETGPPGGCAAKKGGGVPDGSGGDVNVGLNDAEKEAVDEVEKEAVDEVEKEEGESCVDEALQGLKIGDNTDKNNEEDESESKRPTLIEDYYV